MTASVLELAWVLLCHYFRLRGKFEQGRLVGKLVGKIELENLELVKIEQGMVLKVMAMVKTMKTLAAILEGQVLPLVAVFLLPETARVV